MNVPEDSEEEELGDDFAFEEEDDDEDEDDEMELEDYVNWGDEMKEMRKLPSAVKSLFYGAFTRAIKSGDFDIPMLELIFALSSDSELTELLRMSVEKGHSHITLFLLENGVAIDPPPGSSTNKTPLFHVACLYNSVDVIEAFIERGAVVGQEDQLWRTPLWYAMEGGNMDGIKLLAKHGAPMNDLDYYGRTALRWAVENSDVAMVKLLVSLGADWHVALDLSNSAVHYACVSGQVDLVKLFLKGGGNWRASYDLCDTLFHIACRRGHLDIVRLFLKYGATVNLKNREGDTPLLLSCYSYKNDGVHLGLAKWLLDHGALVDETDNYGNTPLCMACRADDDDVVALLLGRGANANWKRNTGEAPLHLAIATRSRDNPPSVSTVRLLVAHGAMVNVQTGEGVTPLHLAVSDGDIFEFLLESGAQVDCAGHQYGYTPLQLACCDNDCSCVAQLLVRAGAQLNVRDLCGATALYKACHYGAVETVHFLLEAGADWSIPTHDGETALHAAAYKVSLDKVRALLDAGAVANISNHRGRTPLHQLSAAVPGVYRPSDLGKCWIPQEHARGAKGIWAKIAQKLLQAGAPVEKADVDGKTALHLASEQGLVEVAQVLLEHMAAKPVKKAT